MEGKIWPNESSKNLCLSFYASSAAGGKKATRTSNACMHHFLQQFGEGRREMIQLRLEKMAFLSHCCRTTQKATVVNTSQNEIQIKFADLCL